MKKMAYLCDKKRILIIDDSKPIAEMLKDHLEFKGYEVSVALNGISGLREAFSFMPDFILLDLEMPDMTGFDILARLQGDYRTKDIKVFIITVKDERESYDKGFLLGAKEYMVKPFSVSSLSELLQASFA